MPLFGRDRYQRLDGAGGGPGRKPSSFCSSATIVVFVALCLVAAWMMASSSNIPVSVSPAENKSEAKDEEDGSRATPIVKHDDSSGAVDDTPNAGDDNKGGEDDAGKKDESGSSGGGDASPINGDEGSGDKVDGGAGATKTPDDGSGGDTDTSPINGDEGSGDKGDGAGATKTPDDGSSGDTSPINGDEGSGDKGDGGGSGATKTPDDGSGGGNDITTRSSVVAGTTNATGNGTTGGREGDVEAGSGNPATGAVVIEGDTPSRNQSFSDENGKTEDGDVAKPEDPEKKVEQSPEDATDDNKDTGGQETTLPDGSSGGMAKNQTSFGDANGKANEGEEVGERSTEEPTSNDTVRGVDDPTMGGVAAKNETFGEGSENTTATTRNSSATAEGNAEEKAELLPRGQADLLNETASAVAKNSSFPTQGSKSVEERKKNKSKKKSKQGKGGDDGGSHVWKLCNVTAGADYIPCLDNEAAIRALKSTKHYEHRERHCPAAAPTCLVPLPAGYRQPIPWPHSRDKIWYHNVPHTMLASYKGHQNWVKVSGEYLTFPGGGTQFTHGALHYIELMEDALPEIAWGRRSRAVLDVGCGVASFGGFLFDKEALTMSFAPKDEHEAQVQFALERGIPAVSAVMGTLRLPFPGNVFDVVHCARCRVPWHIEGGKLLLEVNRLLRPGGLFIWSATPVYRKVPEDVQIWHAMDELTKSMCWEMLKRTSDTVDQTAMVVFKKPSSNDCYDARARVDPPLCEASDDQNAAWNVTLQACMHRVPTDASARGARWPAPWPERLSQTPYWLSESQTGVYGKPAPADFAADQEHWRSAVENSYLTGMGIDWKNVRNVMDMRAVYGGFAAALRDMKVWVMNVVTVDSPDTLPIIYERGLFGMYHDWCESFSTYPRTYDLLHADHLFSRLRSRCKRLLPVMVEVDRILRPDGTLIVRDDKETAQEVRSVAESLHWELRMSVSRQGEELLCLRKTTWRPKEVEAIS